jgi:Lon protease-like protein
VLRLPLLDGYVELTQAAGPLTVPARAPVLTLTNTVLFPYAPAKVAITGRRHHRLLAAIGRETFPAVFAVARVRPEEEAPRSTADLFGVGVVARIRAVKDEGDGLFFALVEAGPRARLLSCPAHEPHLVAELEPLADARVELETGLDGVGEQLRDAARAQLVRELEDATWALDFTAGRNDLATLAGIAAGGMGLSVKEAQRLLEAEPVARVKQVAKLLERAASPR